MPAYGTPPFSKSIYPGQNALAIGLPSLSGGPSDRATDKNESVATGFKSIPIAVAPTAGGGHGYTQRQINWRVNYGTAPGAIQWVLQGAIDDVEGDYIQVDTSSTITNFTQTVASNLRFFRLYAQSVTGACTAAVKLSAV